MAYTDKFKMDLSFFSKKCRLKHRIIERTTSDNWKLRRLAARGDKGVGVGLKLEIRGCKEWQVLYYVLIFSFVLMRKLQSKVHAEMNDIA